MSDEHFIYEGFSSPNGTIVPDDVFDVLLPRLTDPELRVLLYIIRRTFGFKRDSDNISLSQMVDGIRTKDGRILDGGAGISKASVARGLKGLSEKGIIIATRNQSRERGNEPTTYALRFRTPPLSQTETRGSLKSRQALVSPVDPQQTGKQQTDISLSNIRKVSTSKNMLGESEQADKQGKPDVGLQALGDALRQRGTAPRQTAEGYDEDRQVFVDYLADFSREFHDRAPLKSSVTRVSNLYQQAGLPRETFIERMYQARAITKERTGSIRSGKFPYFLSVLEALLGLRDEPGSSRSS